MICAKCGEPKAHRSHGRGPLDVIYKLFRMTPYRCRACRARFYTYRSGATSGLRTPEERKIIELRRRIKWRNSKKTITLYVLASIVAAALVFYLVHGQPD